MLVKIKRQRSDEFIDNVYSFKHYAMLDQIAVFSTSLRERPLALNLGPERGETERGGVLESVTIYSDAGYLLGVYKARARPQDTAGQGV